jgi:DNA-binding transcriptional ArsR family regulator
MGKSIQNELPANELKAASDIMRALAHPKRLSILAYLATNEKPTCVNDIYSTLRLEQSVTSQHLRVLRQTNLVSTTRSGKFVYYSLNAQALHSAARVGSSLANFIVGPPSVNI